MVTWNMVPPINQNGIITMYEVLYQSLDGEIEPLAKNVSVSVMSVVLMNLREYVSYFIAVRAYTSVGAGPYSEGITVRTNEDGGLTICVYMQHYSLHHYSSCQFSH